MVDLIRRHQRPEIGGNKPCQRLGAGRTCQAPHNIDVDDVDHEHMEGLLRHDEVADVEQKSLPVIGVGVGVKPVVFVFYNEQEKQETHRFSEQFAFDIDKEQLEHHTGDHDHKCAGQRDAAASCDRIPKPEEIDH